MFCFSDSSYSIIVELINWFNVLVENNKKFAHTGNWPGPSGWKPDILTTRQYGS